MKKQVTLLAAVLLCIVTIAGCGASRKMKYGSLFPALPKYTNRGLKAAVKR